MANKVGFKLKTTSPSSKLVLSVGDELQNNLSHRNFSLLITTGETLILFRNPPYLEVKDTRNASKKVIFPQG